MDDEEQIVKFAKSGLGDFEVSGYRIHRPTGPIQALEILKNGEEEMVSKPYDHKALGQAIRRALE